MNAYNIAVLTTGDELLSGERTDTNTGTIASILNRSGYQLRCALSVPDQEKEICAALTYLCDHCSFVIITGGLGATADDLTARAAARALGQPLVLNDEALEQVRNWFSSNHRTMEPSNERQALLPQEAEILPNTCGVAPGFHLKHKGCELFFLPGVPREMKAMFTHSVLPILQSRIAEVRPIEQRTLKLFGLPEPRVNSLIPYTKLPQDVKVAFGLDYPLVLLKLRAGGADAQRNLDLTEALLMEPFAEHIVARDDELPEANIGKLLINSGLTLSLAESCTGGLIAALLTSQPGASNFLERGAVVYANSAKQSWLQVPESILMREGAVSAACAKAMAEGLRRSSKTDLALSITGIAGPDGGTAEKPVGTVYIALTSESGTKVKGYNFSGTRERIQRISAFMALEWIRRFILQQQ